MKRWRRNISSLLRSNFFFNYLADAYKLWMQATQYLHSLHQEHAWYCPWSPSVRWRGWSPPFWRLSEPTWTQHSSKRGEEGEGGEGTTQEDVKPVERREKEKEIRGQRRGEEKSRGEEVTIAGRVRKERAEGSSEVHLGKIKHGCKYVFRLRCVWYQLLGSQAVWNGLMLMLPYEYWKTFFQRSKAASTFLSMHMKTQHINNCPW